MNDLNLTKIFNKYVGREIALEEFVMARWKNENGQEETLTGLAPKNRKDSLLQEMEQTARENGLSLRVWFPNMASTMDLRGDRVNAHVEKAADGKYRVADRFELY